MLIKELKEKREVVDTYYLLLNEEKFINNLSTSLCRKL